ncbi:hypothetical protein M427DRAFT_52255 [Gonapodya prolifera JEL478]|uniref:RNA polymerase II-associated protein 1 C-terminal domain-containing protein n=1 Tax=Gonapodya prolifera (strain JEL478) TaxID=1344416 RepID=A0A139AVC2_GONPJ|nr:hypothetical protein M427DRAFT_52255 [Gonapodya prolifera JEL478]|eukprot:KXS20668.1 hypothetical protein M427DRAFT_52255 [Gonapodya prolifera JEL478]
MSIFRQRLERGRKEGQSANALQPEETALGNGGILGSSPILSATVTERSVILPPQIAEPLGDAPKGTGFPVAEHRSTFNPRSSATRLKLSAPLDAVQSAREVPHDALRSSAHGGPPTTTSIDLGAIERENLEKIRNMSKEDIERELSELAGAFDPDLLDFLKDRAEKKLTGRTGQTQNATITENTVDLQSPMGGHVAQATIVEPDQEKGPRPLLPAEKQPLAIPTLEDLRKYFPNEQLVNEKLRWTIDGPSPPSFDGNSDLLAPEKSHGVVFTTRFNLSGQPISPQVALSLPSTLALHHHADDPHSAGYTVTELLTLARSKVAAQKAVAGRAVAGVVTWCGMKTAGGSDSNNDWLSIEDATKILNHMLVQLSVPAVAVTFAADANTSVSVVGLQMILALIDASDLIIHNNEESFSTITELERVLHEDLWCGAVGIVELANPKYRMDLLQRLESTITNSDESHSATRTPSDPISGLLASSPVSLQSVLQSFLSTPESLVDKNILLEVVLKIAVRSPSFVQGFVSVLHSHCLTSNWPASVEKDTLRLETTLLILIVYLCGSVGDTPAYTVITSGTVTTLLRFLVTPVSQLSHIHIQHLVILLFRILFNRSPGTEEFSTLLRPVRDLVVSESVTIIRSLDGAPLAAWIGVLREMLGWAQRVDRRNAESSTDLGDEVIADEEDDARVQGGPAVAALCDELRPSLTICMTLTEKVFSSLGQPENVVLCSSLMIFLAAFFDASILVRPEKKKAREVLETWSKQTSSSGHLRREDCDRDATFLAAVLGLSAAVACKSLPNDDISFVARQVLKLQVCQRQKQGFSVWEVMRSRATRVFLSKWILYPHNNLPSPMRFATGYTTFWAFLPGEEELARAVGRSILYPSVLGGVLSSELCKLPFPNDYELDVGMFDALYWSKDGPNFGRASEGDEGDWNTWLPIKWNWPLQPLRQMVGAATEVNMIVVPVALAGWLESLSTQLDFSEILEPWGSDERSPSKLSTLLSTFLVRIPVDMEDGGGPEAPSEGAYRDSTVSALLGHFATKTFPHTRLDYDEALFSDVLTAFLQEAYGDRTFSIFVLRTLTCLNAAWWLSFWNNLVDQGSSKWRYAFREVKVGDIEFQPLREHLLGGKVQRSSFGGPGYDDVLRAIMSALGVLGEWDFEDRTGVEIDQWEGLYAIAVDLVCHDHPNVDSKWDGLPESVQRDIALYSKSHVSNF